MFLKGSAQRFRMTLLNLPKKSYPSSVDGLVRMGLDQRLADSLKGWIEQLGLAERIGVCLFVEAYARCERMDDYVGKVALERYLARLRIDCELRKTFLKWTKGALAAANTPSKKRSA
jgi:hypothetical protein